MNYHVAILSKYLWEILKTEVINISVKIKNNQANTEN